MSVSINPITGNIRPLSPPPTKETAADLADWNIKWDTYNTEVQSQLQPDIEEVRGQMNASIGQMNTGFAEVEQNAQDAESAKNAAQTSEANALQSKNEAQAILTEVEGHIPNIATDGYTQEVLDKRLNAINPFNGFMGKASKDIIFQADANFTYKTAIQDEYFKVNGKVVDTSGNLELDLETTTDGVDAVPNVYLQDQSVNGLNVPVSRKKGEWVVLDKYISTATQIAETSATVLVDNGTEFYVGQEIFVKPATDTNYTDTIQSISTNTLTLTTSRTKTAENYEISAKNDIYQASENTADMYDYKNDGTVQSVTVYAYETIIYNNDGNDVNGLDGHFYMRKTTNTNDLSAYDYSNTAAWIDLGTAISMSLLNPYFKTKDVIANQVLSIMKEDSTIFSEILVNDVLKTDSLDDMLVNNGWSKKENGLYSKDSIVGTSLIIWETFNSGGYDSTYNIEGRAVASGTPASVADCFIGQTGGNIASASSGFGSEYYDVVYESKVIDCRVSAQEIEPLSLLKDYEKRSLAEAFITFTLGTDLDTILESEKIIAKNSTEKEELYISKVSNAGIVSFATPSITYDDIERYCIARDSSGQLVIAINHDDTGVIDNTVNYKYINTNRY